MIRLAYFCEPQLGGTFSFYEHLRETLLGKGVEMRCVSLMGRSAYKATVFAGREDVEYADIKNWGGEGRRRFVGFVEGGGYQAVMQLSGGEAIVSQLLAYLPSSVATIMRVPMMTRGAYEPVGRYISGLDLVVAVSDRIRDDLVGHFGVSDDMIEVIYHGVDTCRYRPKTRVEEVGGPVRLLYAGRLVDSDKGVLLLPGILRRIEQAGLKFRMRVVGVGDDAGRLRAGFVKAGVSDWVEWVGRVAHDRMAEVYGESDIFILPSRFEGCGFSLIEAMSCGCVPVVSAIQGSLDRIVEDGVCGCLARVGDESGFADRIIDLMRKPEVRRAYSASARSRVERLFGLEEWASRYAEVIHQAVAVRRRRCLNIDEFRPASVSSVKNWRRFVPQTIKNFIRIQMERRGRFV